MSEEVCLKFWLLFNLGVCFWIVFACFADKNPATPSSSIEKLPPLSLSLFHFHWYVFSFNKNFTYGFYCHAFLVLLVLWDEFSRALCRSLWASLSFSVLQSWSPLSFHGFDIQNKEQVFSQPKRNKQLKNRASLSIPSHYIWRSIRFSSVSTPELSGARNLRRNYPPHTPSTHPAGKKGGRLRGGFWEHSTNTSSFSLRAFLYSHCCQPARLNPFTLPTPPEVRMVSNFLIWGNM